MSEPAQGSGDGAPTMIGAALGALVGAAVGAGVWWIASRLRGAAGSEPLRSSDPTTDG